MLRNDGRVFFSGRRKTRRSSGSFSVERRTRNDAGKDRIAARARNPRSGERCRVVINF